MKDSFKFIIDIFEKITKDILAAVYQQFGFSILLAILFMFLYLYAKEHGWKSALCKWWDAFKKDAAFRKIFIFVFYVAMILFKTLLNRDMWMNPLSKVMGEWELSAESIENILLFIPFAVLLLWTFHDKLLGETHKLKMMVWKPTKIVFLCSLSIEFAQLFLRLGTFQFSDLFYNTLGGAIGGLIYWIGCKIVFRKERRKSEDEV